MNWLNSLNLQAKFFVMLLIPLSGLVLFGMQGVLTKSDMMQQMESMGMLSKLAVLSSALVHETQKERGMTAGFLGSKGVKFQSELPKQRGDTDAREKNLQDYLKSFDAKRFGTALVTALTQATGRLDSIGSIRKRVDSLDVPAKEAVEYYTTMNADFLDMVGMLAKLSATPEIASMSTGYAHFLLGKERAGIERAVLTNTFAQEKFGPGFYVVFAQLVAEQNTYFKSFRALSLPGQVAVFEKKFSHLKWRK